MTTVRYLLSNNFMPGLTPYVAHGLLIVWGFPGGSDGEESGCNAGHLGSIPGSGRSLEKEMETHSSTLAWRIPWIYKTF